MFWDNFKKMCDLRGEKPSPVLLKCNISTGSIGRWKSGAWPYSDAVLALADYFDCSTDFLLRGHEFQPSPEPELKPDEHKMLEMFRSLPEDAQLYAKLFISAAYEKEMNTKKEA
ncbi:MAG: hypothetical protein UCN44_11095 [Enterocloster sp.]|nr:hypothetical protein [Enterocloster sp.]